MKHFKSLSALAAAVVVAGACADSATISEPAAPNFDHTGGIMDPVQVCKIGPAGTTATFSVTNTNNPADVVLSDFTATAAATIEDCENNFVTVWVSHEDVFDTVTVTETGATPGLTLERILIVGGQEFEQVIEDSYSGTVTVNNLLGAKFYFKNVGEPTTPPPGGTEGCTPGYWKQRHHFDSWVGYSPGDLFSDAFGNVNAFPGKTLLDVLRRGGGHEKALGRHSVAALLNASSAVDYEYDVAGVISAFNDAFNSGEYEGQKDLFDEANNRGCPLN